MNDRSLRVGLLSRLGVVLVLLLALDALACYFTAFYFANLVYDRWLIDSTRSLAQAVRFQRGAIQFDLPLSALQIFEFDAVDKTYFRISSARRAISQGRSLFRRLGQSRSMEPGWPMPLNGQRVRIVSTRDCMPQANDTVTVTTRRPW